MIRDVTYKGMTTTPGDYECQDGDLSVAYNMISNNGSLVPIGEPITLIDMPDGVDIIYIHANDGYKHYIAVREGKLLYIDADDSSNSLHDIHDFGDESFTEIGSIGNILIVCTSSSMHYILWRDGYDNVMSYLYLGTHIPDAIVNMTCANNYVIEDGIYKFAPYVYERLTEAHNSSTFEQIDDYLPEGSKFVYDDWDEFKTYKGEYYLDKKEEREAITTAIMAKLNEQIANARKQGLFVHPRLIRFALRLYDGEYTQFSAPMLIHGAGTKNSAHLKYTNNAADNAGTCVDVYPYIVDYCIKNLDELKRWGDIVKGISFFASRPIYDFDQNGTIDRLVFNATDVVSVKLPEISEGDQTKQLKNAMDFYRVFDVNLDEYTDSYYKVVFKKLPSLDKKYRTCACRINFTYRFEDDTDNRLAYIILGDKEDIDVVPGKMAQAFASTDITVERMYVSERTTYGTKPRKYTDSACVALVSKKQISLFNAVIVPNSGETKTFSISSYRFNGQPIYPSKLPLSTLEQQVSISDDYFSHNEIKPDILYNYNGRMIYASINRKYYYPGESCVEGFTKTNHPSYAVDSLNFYINIGGKEIVVRQPASTTIPQDSSIASAKTVAGQLLNYLYYPDVRCKKCVAKVYVGDIAMYYELPMERSPFLNGAVFSGAVPKIDVNFETGEINRYDGVDLGKYAVSDIQIQVSGQDEYERLPRTVINSEVNNPFYIKAKGYDEIGNRSIVGLASATMPLSQDQFGKNPVYVFCTDGIYAMRVSDDGYLYASQALSRDVCTNRDSITQLDRAVMYGTERGIMILSGDGIECISESLYRRPADITGLPYFAKLAEMAGISDNSILTTDFRDYIIGCRAIYDYINGRIIVYNTSKSYAYAYSLKSGYWSMLPCNITHTLNSYPEALAVTKDGRVINMSARDGNGQGSERKKVNGFLITRPIKLGNHDVLKTVTKIMQRGTLRKGHVKQVLYGSRDMFNWVMLSSSQDELSRYYYGTPYKYFRVAIICTLDNDESLFGCSIDVTDKYTNQLR